LNTRFGMCLILRVKLILLQRESLGQLKCTNGVPKSKLVTYNSYEKIVTIVTISYYGQFSANSSSHRALVTL
jgi:hypothetical protein